MISPVLGVILVLLSPVFLLLGWMQGNDLLLWLSVVSAIASIAVIILGGILQRRRAVNVSNDPDLPAT